MATITTRAGKGSPLTNTEVDDNFSNLNSAKYESGSAAEFASVDLPDDGKINLGDTNDLEIFHQSSNNNSIIRESGGGVLSLQTNGSEASIWDTTNAQHMGRFINGAEVQLQYDGDTVFSTTATGVNVTGEVAATSLDISGDIDVDGTANLDGLTVDGASEITRLGLGTAAHASAALHITTTNQHIRFNNGSELGVIDLDSDGVLNIWAHGDGEVLKLRTGSGAGADILTINGEASTFSGTVTANAGVVVDNFTLDGTTLALSSGDLTLDAGAGDIVLDAHGNQIAFKGSSGQIGFIDLATGRMDIKASNADADMRFQGNDGGVAINALTLDMSEAGAATFNSTVKTTGLDLEAIAQSKSDTAVDVFVYDTRKDSDGGAWRKRTQNTSWYNEASGSNRSSRKEFPSVAVLAFNTSQELFIYDGDDPDLPIWAKYTNFTQDSGGFASITAINGSIYCGQASSTAAYSGNGYFQLNFAVDYFFSNIISIFSTHKQGRAEGLLTSYNYKSRGDRTTPLYGLVAYQVADIAVTVLPNAPIDADTGLPVPTIAVATDGGVSVIKDDGSVVDIVSNTLAHETPREVKFVDDKVFWVAGNNYDNAWSSVNSTKIPSGDITTPYASVTTANALVSKYTPKEWNVAHHAGDLLIPINMQSPRTGALIELAKDDELIIGGKGSDDHGTVVKVVENVSDPESGMLAQIASDFATGYQVGDIKLATLSDTDTADVTGSELVTNGTFASNANSWDTNNGSSIAWNGSSDQTATVTSGGSVVWNGATQVITGLTVGKTYVATADIITSNNWGAFGFAAGANSGNRLGSYTSWNSGSSFPLKGRAQFVATSTSHVLSIDSLNTTNATVTKVDNISVRQAEEDRSVNNNGLQIFGTVTKDPVATGADLVRYVFGTNNYLKATATTVPTGTNDSCYMWWSVDTAGDMTQLYLGDPSTDGHSPTNGVNVWSYGPGMKYRYAGNQFDALASHGVVVGQWTHHCMLSRNGLLEVYINGRFVHRAAAAHNGITETDLYVGKGHYNNDHSDGMALLRISATAPTAEQIKKIYEDEKVLFQENAKATLAGTSDTVTALAYDDDTELLHVGTSAGRSVFHGLRRVDNTTDAVGSAISASNGLVAED